MHFTNFESGAKLGFIEFVQIVLIILIKIEVSTQFKICKMDTCILNILNQI